MVLIVSWAFIVAGAATIARFRDLRRLDDPFVAAFASLSVFWLLGVGLGPLFPRVIQPTGTALLLILGGAVVYMAGGLSAEVLQHRRSRQLAAHEGFPSILPLTTGGLAVHLVVLGLGVLAAVSFFVMAGIPIFGGELEQGRIDARAGRGYLVIAAITAISLPVLGIAAHVSRSFRWRSVLLMLGLAAVSVLVLAAIGNRGPVAKVLLAGLWIAFLARGKLPPWRLCIALAGAVLVALALFGALRSGAEVTLGHVVSRTGWQLYVNTSNLSHLTQVIPERAPYLYGESYLIDAAVLLPGSQPNLGAYLKELVGLEFAGGGITVGLFGESYANWGPIGALAICFAVGAGLWPVRRFLTVRNPLDLAWVVLISINVAGLMQTGLMSVFLYNLVPLTGLWILMKAAISLLDGGTAARSLRVGSSRANHERKPGRWHDTAGPTR